MRPVYLIGSGQTPVAEHWDRSLERLALEALLGAQADAGGVTIEALYVANALSSITTGQSQLGAVIASAAGLGPIEALRIEAAGASGGVALRQAYLAVASGAYDCVAVVGVEKVTDVLDGPVEAALAQALETVLEADQGLTLTAGWALLQQRYAAVYGYTAGDFAPFAVNAHANGVNNPNALYRFPITPAKFAAAAPVAAPIGLLDSSTIADGAAVVIVGTRAVAAEAARAAIRIAASTVVTAPLALAARPDPLWLEAAARSATQAFAHAGLDQAAIDVAEVSDQHGIVAALSLEAAGFVERGMAPRWAADGAIFAEGQLPLSNGGGCKARGDTVGALGVYQIVEVIEKLRRTTGARHGFAQCLGGLGTTAATHILVRE